MKTIRIIWVLLVFSVVQFSWAESDTTPSLFSLSYFELYGTPVEPLAYTQIDTNALGFNILAEYNPSYYASFGLNYEKTTFYDGFNSTISFLGLETRFFGAPNGKSAFAPYVYGGVGLGLNAGTGNQLKAGLGSRLQLFSPMFLDFSAGSNWIDSGLQYLTFRGGLSVSFDLPKVEPSPMVKPTAVPTVSLTTSVTPMITAMPVNTLVDLLVSPTITQTPTNTATTVIAVTDTPTTTVSATPVLSMTSSTAESQVKAYYRSGMKAFGVHQYLTAVAKFKKAIAVNEPSVQSYFYAESNAMLGVIYQFDLTKVPGHNKLAIKYYKRALKIDPRTKSAKKYLAMLQVSVKVHQKPTAVDDSTMNAIAPTVVPTSQPAGSNKTQSIDVDMSTTSSQSAVQTSPVVSETAH